MKKRLNDALLTPGDIILTTTGRLTSGVIRKVTNSDISHAMLYVQHCSVIHAYGEGVHSENTQRILFDPELAVHVLRLRSALPSQTARDICENVRSKVGTEYSTFEAIRAATGRGKEFTSRQFCSRLVAQAYEKFGYSLVKNPNYCTPHDLLESQALIEIDNPTVEISAEESDSWDNHLNTPQLMRDATNKLLSAARKLDPDIQNISDLNEFLVRYPEHDSAVNELYIDSGYLDVWKFEFNKNPWHYDLDTMEGIDSRHKKSIQRYCQSTLDDDPRDQNRFTKNLTGYLHFNRQYPRKTFATLIELYRILVDLHAQRFDVAQAWIQKHGENGL